MVKLAPPYRALQAAGVEMRSAVAISWLGHRAPSLPAVGTFGVVEPQPAVHAQAFVARAELSNASSARAIAGAVVRPFSTSRAASPVKVVAT